MILIVNTKGKIISYGCYQGKKFCFLGLQWYKASVKATIASDDTVRFIIINSFTKNKQYFFFITA